MKTLAATTHPTSSAAEDLPPELRQQKKYTFLKKLGGGGMGVVYLAEHNLMKRKVAVKVIPPEMIDNPSVKKRFLLEVVAAAALEHANVVRAYSAEEFGKFMVFEMEFVDGQDLGEIVKNMGPLPVNLAVDYIKQAALGLAHAHGKGLVHRDIKPSNLMRSEDGRVKVLDFGLVKGDAGSALKAGQSAATGLTGSNTIMGTPDYISPEQIQDAGSAAAPADIYSLGATFFYLLAGEPPFVDPENKLLNIYLAHLSTPPRRIDSLRPDVPREIADLIERMLAKAPGERPAGAQAVADQLGQLGKKAAIPASPPPKVIAVAAGTAWQDVLPALPPPVLPKRETLPEMKVSTVNAPKPAAVADWFDGPADGTLIVAPAVRKPIRWKKPALALLGAVAVFGAIAGAVFFASQRQARHADQLVREIREEIDPHLKASADPAEAERLWADFESHHADLAASEKLADLRSRIATRKKEEGERLSKWKSQFDSLRANYKAMDDSAYRAAAAKVDKLARTGDEADKVKQLTDRRIAEFAVEEAEWRAKLQPLFQKAEDLVTEAKDRRGDLGQLQKLSDRIKPVPAEIRSAVDGLPKRLTAQAETADRLLRSLLQQTNGIDVAIGELRGLEKLTDRLKATSTGPGWSQALAAFLQENPRSELAAGFGKVLTDSPMWEAPMEWAPVVRAELVGNDPWARTGEDAARRLKRLRDFADKYAAALKDGDFLPGPDVQRLLASERAQQELPMLRGQLAAVFDNKSLSNLLEFRYTAILNEKFVTTGTYYIEKDREAEIKTGKVHPKSLAFVHAKSSEGNEGNPRTFNATRIDDPVPAKHTRLCERLARECRRSTETDWLATAFTAADEIVADKDVDVALRAVLLRRTLEAAASGCPEAASAIKAKIDALEKVGGAADLNWVDPGDERAKSARLSLTTYFLGRPSFNDVRDEVKKERENILRNLRRAVPRAVGYAVKTPRGERRCQLVDERPANGELFVVATDGGKPSWRKVGNLRGGLPSINVDLQTDGQPIFLKKSE